MQLLVKLTFQSLLTSQLPCKKLKAASGLYFGLQHLFSDPVTEMYPCCDSVVWDIVYSILKKMNLLAPTVLKNSVLMFLSIWMFHFHLLFKYSLKGGQDFSPGAKKRNHLTFSYKYDQ